MDKSSQQASPFNPRKRPRTEKNDTDNTATHRNHLPDKDIWFADGNIVILVQDTAFKVHRGVLSKHSEVFADMFDIPQPSDAELERYDGCPLVHLRDTASDVKHMLSALYDGGNPKYFYRTEPLAISAAMAMLRLGSKYHITRLREEAVRCFEASFPSTLEGADDAGLTVNPRRYRSITCEDVELMDLVTLAQACDVPSILPGLFYSLTSLSYEELVDGVEDGRWSKSDLVRCLNGFARLEQADLRQLQPILLHDPTELCRTHDTCRNVCRLMLSDFIDDEVLGDARCLTPANRWMAGVIKQSMCKPCREHLVVEHDSLRRNTWGDMMDFFE